MEEGQIRDTRLLRSTVEAYAGIAIAIITVVFSMTWWVKAFLIMVLYGIIVDLIFRSRWTIAVHRFLKIIFSAIAFLLLIAIGWNPIKEQWMKDHPIKQTEQKLPLPATPDKPLEQNKTPQVMSKANKSPDPSEILLKALQNKGLIEGVRYDKDGHPIGLDAKAKLTGNATQSQAGQVKVETAQPEQGHILGPRFEFAGLKAEHNGGYSMPVIQVHNTSEFAVSSYHLIGSVFLSDFENTLENEDVNKIISEMEHAAKKVVLVPVDQLQITRGMGVKLELQQQFSDGDIASVNNGSKKMYVVMLAVYRTPKTPNNRMWVTELCARVTKPFTDFQSCPLHNRYFFSDRSLNKID